MKKKRSMTSEEREKYWTTVIEAARRNPRGVKQYLLDRDISKDVYYQWFTRLRQEHPEWENLPPAGRRQSAALSTSKKEAATQVVPREGRRRFGADYKAKILRETDDASPGEVSSILRREGLYASHLKNWRTERAETGLAPKKRGPKANPLTAENRALRAENERLQKRLRQQELLLEFQKKIAEILNSEPQEKTEKE
jgi:transposase